ncbi:hypothetical protein DXG03_005016 [Asterophora parasitica]|uniref:DNA damage-binding protein 1 n=1 Tax=Asterophora parasitica TaxID=117018 RepID=A0A9P7GK04_9AGAR|nr:hypothetical protein DXG03_005016 [Asterophora parasitica]
MKIVTTFHQPSSVLASVKCQLASRDLEHLVVAKTNRIEVYSLRPHGLQHECGIDVWGSVVTVKSIPIAGSNKSNLLLYLGHPDPELVFLTYSVNSSGVGELTVKKTIFLYERTPRQAEVSDVTVHPSGKLAVVNCYVGKLRVVLFNLGNHDSDFDVMLPELNVLGLAFLPLPEDEYALAILTVDYQERVQLLARDILLDELELSSTPSSVLTPTAIPEKVIPVVNFDCVPQLIAVPAEEVNEDRAEEDTFMGGILVVGGKRIVIYELASGQSQAKQRSKRRRLDSRKKSTDEAQAQQARGKELERERRNRKAQGTVHWPWSDVFAVCAVDPLVPRYLIGDAYGRVAMLSVLNVKEQGLILVPLGETSPPTTLTYLANQTFFVGSHLGDSQVLQISPAPTSALTYPTLPIPFGIKTTPAANLYRPSTGKGKGRATDDDDDGPKGRSKGTIVESKGSYLNVVEIFKNIAPIIDAIMVDPDNSGERQIVTCSGGGNKGSINIVRNGADFKELGSILGMTNVVNVWGVRDQLEDTYVTRRILFKNLLREHLRMDTHILVSTLDATQLYRIDDAGGETTLTYVEETGLTEKSGLITDLHTLAFGNVARRVVDASGKARYENSRLVVQVTKRGAQLLECHAGLYQRVAQWAFEGGLEVTAASVNASQVVVSTTGGKLVSLGIADNQFKVVADRPTGVLSETSAVSCTPIDGKPYSNYVTVSYWGTNVVEIFILSQTGFVSIAKSAPLPALVRSLLLHNFGSDDKKGADHHPYLLAGLADGSVAYFSWKEKLLNDRKIISLGHSPVSLTVCLSEGKRAVFAAGNRATVLSWEKKRIHSSPIMLKISLGLDNPRRIAYEPSRKVFGVGITCTTPYRVGELEAVHGVFRLLDDATFSSKNPPSSSLGYSKLISRLALANFNCATNEEVTAVATYSPVINGKATPVFVVGTVTFADEKEPSEGRLLIFSAYSFESAAKTSLSELSLLASADVGGAVYSITFVKGMIVLAVNSSVFLYRLKSSDQATPSLHLEKLSEWTHNYIVTSLASYGDRIVAGDKINSVSLLKVVNEKLQNIARDYGPLWPICVEASDADNIIAANDALNIFTFTLTRTLGRSVLERSGHYYIADLVTKFIRGSIVSSESNNDAALEAKHVFFTSSGRIGVVVDVTDADLSLHLTALQRNLAGTITGIGGESHTRFRAPKNTHGRSDADATSFGFIDGDFLEQFLTRLGSPEEVEKIVVGNSAPERLTMPVEEMQKVLENLQSMH